MDGVTAQITTEVGELLTTWVGIKFDEVDAIVAEAQDRAGDLPDLRDVWALFGELTVRLHFLESEVERLKGERP